MTEITPTPPASLLVNQTLATIVPSLPASLPAVLPVQLVALPPDLAVPMTPVTVNGVLQLLLNNKASFSTSAGVITLNVPQLRGHPGLFDAIKAYMADHTTLQLQLLPGSSGTTEARLLFAPPAPRAPVTTAPPSTPNVATLVGQTVAAVVLPALPAESGEVPSSSPPSMPPQSETVPPFLSQTKVPVRSEQYLRSFLPPARADASITGSVSASVLPPQSVLNVRVQQVILPGQPLPALQPDEILVVAQNAATSLSQPVVLLGTTPLLLKTSVPVPPGSQLVLKLPAADGTVPTEEVAKHASSWPALQELLKATTTPALQAFIQQRLPQMNAALPGALLILLAAMQQGDARNWLGRNGIAALEAGGRKALLDNLQNELTRHAEQTSDPVVGEWRVYHLPWLDQGQLHPLHIYVHHNQQRQPQGQEAEQNAAKKQTRFVIDVTFTRLGSMQLDGFVQQQQFDLILRSQQPLAPALRDELRAAFTDALGAVGYHGQLLFQPGGQNWLMLEQKSTIRQA